MEVVFISLVEKKDGQEFGWKLKLLPRTGFFKVHKIRDLGVADKNGFQIGDVVTKIFDVKLKKYVDMSSKDFFLQCTYLTKALISIRRTLDFVEEGAGNEKRPQNPPAPRLLPKKQIQSEQQKSILPEDANGSKKSTSQGDVTRRSIRSRTVNSRFQPRTQPYDSKILPKKINRNLEKNRNHQENAREIRQDATRPATTDGTSSDTQDALSLSDIDRQSASSSVSDNKHSHSAIVSESDSFLRDNGQALILHNGHQSNNITKTIPSVNGSVAEPELISTCKASSANSPSLFIVDLDKSDEEKRTLLTNKRLKIAAKLKDIKCKNQLIQSKIENSIAKKATYNEDAKKIELEAFNLLRDLANNCVSA